MSPIRSLMCGVAWRIFNYDLAAKMYHNTTLVGTTYDTSNATDATIPASPATNRVQSSTAAPIQEQSNPTPRQTSNVTRARALDGLRKILFAVHQPIFGASSDRSPLPDKPI